MFSKGCGKLEGGVGLVLEEELYAFTIGVDISAAYVTA